MSYSNEFGPYADVMLDAVANSNPLLMSAFNDLLYLEYLLIIYFIVALIADVIYPKIAGAITRKP